MAKHLALFRGLDTAGANGLWVTDGTAAGTFELTGISGAFTGGFGPSFATFFNGEVLFAGPDTANLTGLWVTDGTAAGTFELTGISGADTSLSGGLRPFDLTLFNGEVLLSGFDTAGANGLWVRIGLPGVCEHW
jgi:ELWxxDGT repeat protein